MTKVAFVAVLVLLAACGHGERHKPVACVPTPQWYVADKEGVPTSAVFVCFGEPRRPGEFGPLMYNGRQLTQAEILALLHPKTQDNVPVATPQAAADQNFIKEGKKTVGKMRKLTDKAIKQPGGATGL